MQVRGVLDLKYEVDVSKFCKVNFSKIWKVWKIILDLLRQLVEVNVWKREPRSK